MPAHADALVTGADHLSAILSPVLMARRDDRHGAGSRRRIVASVSLGHRDDSNQSSTTAVLGGREAVRYGGGEVGRRRGTYRGAPYARTAGPGRDEVGLCFRTPERKTQ